MFKEMTHEEMLAVDGGSGIAIGIVLGTIVEAATRSITGKGTSEHLSDAVDSVAKSASSSFDSYMRNSEPNTNLIPDNIHTR